MSTPSPHTQFIVPTSGPGPHPFDATSDLTAGTLAELIPHWQLALRAQAKACATINLYTSSTERYLFWCQTTGRPPIVRTTLETWMVHLLQTGNKPGTVRVRQQAVRRFGAWLTTTGQIPGHPFVGIKGPIQRTPAVQPLSDDELPPSDPGRFKRGCGLSDWDMPQFGFDAWVSDLETVVDAAGIDRFPLLGVSQGGAVAIEYAARHPERVTKLILAGAYARGREVRAKTQDEQDAAALDLELARVGWKQQDPSFLRVFASQFIPDGTSEDWDAFTDYQRQTAPPENGVRFLEEFARIDVSHVAPLVQCPTLILHSRDDRRVPRSQAAELAALIPDSELVLLDSSSHLLGAGEPAWPEFLSHVDEFLS